MVAADEFELRSQIARREQDEAIRRQEEARRLEEARRGLSGTDRQTFERYKDNLVRGEPGLQGLRREGEGDRRIYGYEPRR